MLRILTQDPHSKVSTFLSNFPFVITSVLLFFRFSPPPFSFCFNCIYNLKSKLKRSPCSLSCAEESERVFSGSRLMYCLYRLNLSSLFKSILSSLNYRYLTLSFVKANKIQIQNSDQANIIKLITFEMVLVYICRFRFILMLFIGFFVYITFRKVSIIYFSYYSSVYLSLSISRSLPLSLLFF